VATEVSEREAREVAEAAREQDWKLPSFARELYLGAFRLELIHPQPRLDTAATEKGERLLERLGAFLERTVDPLEIESEARIPEQVIEGLKELGVLGMRVPEQYGGLGLSQVYYNRALMLAGSYHPSISSLLSAHQSIGLAQPLTAGEMGVVVQSMVRAKASGVMFTCDPNSGDPSVVCIEGSWGLGSAVVGGEVTPDQFIVAKPTMSISDRQVRRKESQHVPASGGGGGVAVEPIADDLAERPCLEENEIIELANIGRDLERTYDSPQDVEWSVDERFDFPDSVFVLQCRPETAASRQKREPVHEPGGKPTGWIAKTLSKGA
jgi:hypothetical protein